MSSLPPDPSHPAELEVARGDSTAVLTIRRGELLLAFDEAAPPPALGGEITELGFATVASERFSADELRTRGLAWITVPGGDTVDAARRLHERLPELWLVAPVYAPPGGGGESDAAAPVLSTFIVRPEEGVDIDELREAIEAEGPRFDQAWSDLVPPLLRFDIDPPGLDGFAVQRRIEGTPGVAAAAFDWINLDPLQGVPDSRDWALQWNLDAIGMPEAWDSGEGSEDVLVAIVDSGFDLDHAGLAAAFAPGATHAWFSRAAKGGLTRSKDVRVSMTPTGGDVVAAWRWHGTAVAGIIGARPVGRAGPMGIAPECRIVPIRVSPMTDATVSAGLAWAAKQNARVVNLSITGAGWSDAIATAIGILVSGGAVIHAAAGNGRGDEPDVVYPASDPRVVAVGATTQEGTRKTRQAAREDWASRGGVGLDVMAPGICIPTIDATGAAGYNAGSGAPVRWYGHEYPPQEAGDDKGEYLWVFTGTSAAVAHATGLAALLFAQGPDRSARDVRELIESTCTPVEGAASYPRQRDGRPWSPLLGFGQIDAARALAAGNRQTTGGEGMGTDKGRTGRSGSRRPRGERVGDLIVDQLVDNPCDVPDLVVLVGFEGESPRDGVTRIYNELSLGEYLEVEDADIEACDAAGDRGEQGQRFWVRQGASVRQVRQRRVTVSATAYLSGPLGEAAITRASDGGLEGGWGPEPTKCTTCRPSSC